MGSPDITGSHLAVERFTAQPLPSEPRSMVTRQHQRDRRLAQPCVIVAAARDDGSSRRAKRRFKSLWGHQSISMGPDQRASTVEGQIMRVADLIAYVNHDIDDATRAGLLRSDDVPGEWKEYIGINANFFTEHPDAAGGASQSAYAPQLED